MKIIKTFSGYSGNKVFLIERNNKLLIRKIGDISKNVEKLKELKSKNYNVPEIYSYSEDILDMEYIHGLDIKNYLLLNPIFNLSNFIISILSSFSENCSLKDYSSIYDYKLSKISINSIFPFTKYELIDKLPKNLPSSIYHGDLTLENIINSGTNFYLIDPITTVYDSYIFDIAKLRQDLECGWFIRKEQININVKLKNLQNIIFKKYPIANNNYLLILMLLRVYPYMRSLEDKNWVKNKIILLWNK